MSADLVCFPCVLILECSTSGYDHGRSLNCAAIVSQKSMTAYVVDEQNVLTMTEDVTAFEGHCDVRPFGKRDRNCKRS
jgi:hypothetical protein